ncbi:ABC transporter ATP-binding protein [Eremococcus coleocola]|uniref:ABC transporter, ATP-binding protein n=1 Tax=Eremococcus coleocola ACS-139-V-Col8 TaxID=908337 RepID=E4KNC5_9LACT|nr:sn-glycerol-3-phosphate ABC transporter ATP-binding protein UgpC [Eremococcus coleocola]EFR31545.1 ABC transporter, ATP-binding protein [Eremococcus coleocola ACS-139-V-Col8]
MVEINLKNIQKKYKGNDTYSVTDFNIDIQDREFIVFVGPSGCGKSTTLRMIAGLEDITEGQLIIDGQVMNDVEPKDRNIAMVFQNYALYPHMTVFDNMAYGLKLRKYTKDQIKARVDHAAEILGLTPYLERKPAALSGGQRQRVALGRAIVREAKVFLMDEPLSNLDAKLRVQMRTEIAKLHHELETTSIYVTHDQTEAMTLASRIVVMNDGNIMQIGTPTEVYNHPDNVFVASFMGSPAMNFFNVTYEKGRVTTADGLSWAVFDAMARKLNDQGYEGKQLIMGIRPEDIHDEPVMKDTMPEAIIQAHIQVVEMTGAEMMLYCKHDQNEFIARVDTRTEYNIGDDVDLVFDMNKTHFFDPETENVIR